jgi:hypothetical protein
VLQRLFVDRRFRLNGVRIRLNGKTPLIEQVEHYGCLQIRAVRWARWGTLAIFGVLALLFLNSALYSAWAAGGPPAQFKAAWEHRALQQFCRAMAFVLFASTVFCSLTLPLRIRPLRLIVAVLGVALLLVPAAHEFMLVDACLDSGGRWGGATFVCER